METLTITDREELIKQLKLYSGTGLRVLIKNARCCFIGIIDWYTGNGRPMSMMSMAIKKGSVFITYTETRSTLFGKDGFLSNEDIDDLVYINCNWWEVSGIYEYEDTSEEFEEIVRNEIKEHLFPRLDLLLPKVVGNQYRIVQDMSSECNNIYTITDCDWYILISFKEYSITVESKYVQMGNKDRDSKLFPLLEKRCHTRLDKLFNR